LVAANLLIASSFPASVVALRGWDPVLLTSLRFVVAAAAFGPLAVRVLRNCTRSQVVRLATLACLGLWLQMVLIYAGINASKAAIAAVIVGLEPVLIALWAALLLAEPFTRRRAGGLCVGLVGSVLVAGLGSGAAHPLGLALLLGTALTWSWYTVASKALLRSMSAVELTASVSVLGAAFGVVPSIVAVTAFGGWHSPGAAQWAAMLYLGVGNSVLGYLLWNRALHVLPAASVGSTLYAQPVLGAGLSWLALREHLPGTFLPGSVLVLGGVFIATRRPRADP
jgi:drug/metabolite transporter (DMT)-like permease